MNNKHTLLPWTRCDLINKLTYLLLFRKILPSSKKTLPFLTIRRPSKKKYSLRQTISWLLRTNATRPTRLHLTS